MSRDLVDVQLGAAIQSRRAQISLSAAALAERMSRPYAWVQAVEAGDVRLRTSQLTEICAALEIPPEDLFILAHSVAGQPVSA